MNIYFKTLFYFEIKKKKNVLKNNIKTYQIIFIIYSCKIIKYNQIYLFIFNIFFILI